MIEVRKISETLFEVTVVGAITTDHRVTLSETYYQRLTKGRIPKETLVERSFQFLLERESNTMIFRSFDLPVISNYFPEYEPEIKRMIGE